MTVSKRVAKSGAVTLPRQLRQDTGILPGVPVDIEADEDGDVQKRSWRSLKDNGCGRSKKEG